MDTHDGGARGAPGTIHSGPGGGLLSAVRPGFTTISPHRELVASFDREGRLFSFVEKGVTYRRTLASDVEARWRSPSPGPGKRRPRRRRRLRPEEARDVFARALAAAASVRSQADGELRARLDGEILPWTPEKLQAEARRFAAVYAPIPILPPDQYLSIVLQATEGCTWNRCTFCTFYQGRPFRAKTDDEFQRHVAQVKHFFGRGATMRKSLFLADGNALALSSRRLVPMVEAARSAFPRRRLYGFIDVYSGEQKSVFEWKRLKQLGLHRVYIGMETGLDELLAFLNKPGSRAELLDFVHRLKAAGLAVGLIVMVGVGGAPYRRAHGEATLTALEQMPLEAGDLVYLSPFVEQPGSAYVPARRAAGLTPLGDDEVEAELSRLARAVRAFGVKAARYDIREFMY